MTEFGLERCISPGGAVLCRVASSARQAAAALILQARRVRYPHSIHLPEDETCFLLVEVALAGAVREAARRVALTFERGAEAVER